MDGWETLQHLIEQTIAAAVKLPSNSSMLKSQNDDSLLIAGRLFWDTAMDEAFEFLAMQVATHPILTHVCYAEQRSRYTAPWLAEPHAGCGLR